jgi:hypothetical protein
VRTIRWDDVELGTGVWTIEPRSARKGRPEYSSCRRLALDLVVAQPRIVFNPYVFAATIGNGPFNAFSRKPSSFSARQASKGGLRRTAETILRRV